MSFTIGFCQFLSESKEYRHLSEMKKQLFLPIQDGFNISRESQASLHLTKQIKTEILMYSFLQRFNHIYFEVHKEMFDFYIEDYLYKTLEYIRKGILLTLKGFDVFDRKFRRSMKTVYLMIVFVILFLIFALFMYTEKKKYE